MNRSKSALNDCCLPGSIAQKVFITDGALWINNWLSKTYGQATLILDYFHVSEKLGEAASYAVDPKGWLKEQCDQLLQGRSREVVEKLKALSCIDKGAKSRLIGYLESNHERMRYDKYRERGLLIGSGPVEASHRTVLQVRMKRSGQRWSDKGAPNMIRLRTALLSGKFNIITDLFKNIAAYL